jgi:DNA-binding response OmpR family regulator
MEYYCKPIAAAVAATFVPDPNSVKQISMYSNRPLVLIADDDEQLVEALTRRCEQLGLNVEAAYDGLAAVNVIDLHEPDLVILDVNMPQGSGLDVCEMIGRGEMTRRIPVIMLTGRKDAATVRRCHNLLAYYVQKCTNAWSRIEPLLGELLNLPSHPACGRESTIGCGSATAGDADPSCLETSGKRTASDESQVQQGLEATGYFAAAQNGRPWILCIDDDIEFSLMLKLRLEEHGVNVLRAFVATDGYRYALISEARAVILDYEMNGGNGEYTLRRLKENPLTEQVPVIVLTGQRDKSLERRMYNLGAVRFFSKPVEWPQLWEALRGYLVNVEQRR